MLAIPGGLVFLVGILLNEPHMPNFNYRQVFYSICYCNVFLCSGSYVVFRNQVSEKFVGAGKAMWTTLKSPNVWRPCLYMYLSLALCLDINEGLFYWYTDSKDGPKFSQVVFHC